MIFNCSKTVTLDQLKKHIKDTIDITENNKPELVEILESLRDTATIWKIFANTLLKVRPIENMSLIVSQHDPKDDVAKQTIINSSSRDLFCICR